jgi:hypothetical protein
VFLAPVSGGFGAPFLPGGDRQKKGTFFSGGAVWEFSARFFWQKCGGVLRGFLEGERRRSLDKEVLSFYIMEHGK